MFFDKAHGDTVMLKPVFIRSTPSQRLSCRCQTVPSPLQLQNNPLLSMKEYTVFQGYINHKLQENNLPFTEVPFTFLFFFFKSASL